MADVGKARRAMAEENFSGWLFFNLLHRDTISDRILNIPRHSINTRPWIYLIHSSGEIKLVHAIEEGILDHLPGKKMVYTSRKEYTDALMELSVGQSRTAAQFAGQMPDLSFLDHGTAGLLTDCGFTLCSSINLIQRFLGILDYGDIKSHEDAAAKLYGIVDRVWKRLEKEMKQGYSLTEGDVQNWIIQQFRELNLYTDSPPLVAAGRNTANPHYQVPVPPGGLPSDMSNLQPKRGALLQQGEPVQFDLWARNMEPHSVYGDISWVGILEQKADEEQKRAFNAIVKARELGLSFITEAFRNGIQVCGFEVDKKVRFCLEEDGYGHYLKHRTGHAIDREVHGFGVNLDSIEFPDSRTILEGSCFSIEPGVYMPDFGMRTEINVYIHEGMPVVSGGRSQAELLCFS